MLRIWEDLKVGQGVHSGRCGPGCQLGILHIESLQSPLQTLSAPFEGNWLPEDPDKVYAAGVLICYLEMPTLFALELLQQNFELLQEDFQVALMQVEIDGSKAGEGASPDPALCSAREVLAQ
jgi:hypothetical protein